MSFSAKVISTKNKMLCNLLGTLIKYAFKSFRPGPLLLSPKAGVPCFSSSGRNLRISSLTLLVEQK